MKLSELNLLDVGNTIQMVGAIYAGNGQMLLALFPEDQGAVEVEQDHSYGDCMGSAKAEFRSKDGAYLTIHALEMDSADWEKFVRQTDVMETEVLTKASDGTLAKVILRKSTRQIDTNVQWRVFKRDGYACRYCGKDDVPLTVDHLVCWEEGGPSTENNLVAADKRCNKVRGNLPYSQWLEHPHYKRVSVALTEKQRAANLRLLETLPGIPRMVHSRSR